MKIIKTLSDVGTIDIKLEESESKHLDIIFGGTGDLYWIFDNQEVADLQSDPMYDTFIISKKDNDIYVLFDELYEDLITGNIYRPHVLPDYCLINDPNAQKNENRRCAELNGIIRSSIPYKKLVNNGLITWYSDEEYRDNAEIVRISKKEDYILLEFIRQTKIDEQGNTRFPGWYFIRFRTSGSTYTPCDIVFWRHFDNLQQYVPSVNTDLDDKNKFIKEKARG